MESDEREDLINGFCVRALDLWTELFITGLSSFAKQKQELVEWGLSPTESSDLARKTLSQDEMKGAYGTRIQALFDSFREEISDTSDDEAQSIFQEAEQRFRRYLEEMIS